LGCFLRYLDGWMPTSWAPCLRIAELRWHHCEFLELSRWSWSLFKRRQHRFKRSPKEFLRRFVTVDETWIHSYTPKTKEQSKQWTSPGEPAPKKAKTVPSVGKVMATVFFGIHKVWSTSTTCSRATRSQGCTMPSYWADSPLNCRTYGPIWRRKKCSSIMTTHRLTLPPSPRPNWATNCYPIHHILQPSLNQRLHQIL